MNRRRLIIALSGMALSAATLVGSGQAAQPQSYNLEPVRLEAEPSSSAATRDQWRYHNVSPQHFFWQLRDARSIEASQEEFKRIVKKEPEKYLAKEPLRGAAKLGSQQFVFVLDRKDEKSKGYDRIYFDLNGNGDLTDDRPIEAASARQLPVGPRTTYTQSIFPRVDLGIDVDGKKLDYCFLFQLVAYGSGDMDYVSASLRSAVYRRGEITLDGKKWTVALLDYNSNGRFDDVTKIHDNVRGPQGELYPDYGDVLLVDAEKPSSSQSARTAVSTEQRQYLGKINGFGGKLYELKVSPRGDELTLTPSSVPLGKISGPHAPCSLELIGDLGYLSLSLDKSGTAEVPAGRWRLLSYTLSVENWRPPAKEKEKEKEDDKAEAKPSLWNALKKALFGPSISVAQPLYGPANLSLLSARGTVTGKPIAVEAGQTAALKFGPPYKVAAKLDYIHQGAAGISLAVTGAEGEVVSNLIINGYRPTKPKISIADADGKVVVEGDFEYG